jgi:hypothetical protein
MDIGLTGARGVEPFGHGVWPLGEILIQDKEFYEDGQRDGPEQGRQKGLEEGQQQESLALVQRQLRHRLGDLSEVWRVRLSVPKGFALASQRESPVDRPAGRFARA